MIKKMKSLFIDNTITLNSPFNTGIQRTVRRLTEESNNNVHFKSYIINLNDINKSSEKKTLIRVPSVIKNTFNIFLNKIGLFEIYSLILFKISCYKFFRNTNVNESYFLNIDANWGPINLYFLDKFKKNGGKVISIYYDNGPYLHPEYFYPGLVTMFKKYWNECFKKSDLILCISRTICNELQDLINKDIINVKNNNLIIDYFYLGNDHTSMDIKNLPINVTSKLNIKNYLVVGSIEPRKNNEYIFDVFETILNTRKVKKETLNLIFIYNNEWKQKNLIKKIKLSKYFNKNIFLLDDVNDRELLYFYESSYALINASFYEGYGLGIAEALSKNIKVFCSNNSTFKELFSQSVIFFDNKNSSDLVEKIISDIDNPYRLKHINLPSWNKSFMDLISKIQKV